MVRVTDVIVIPQTGPGPNTGDELRWYCENHVQLRDDIWVGRPKTLPINEIMDACSPRGLNCEPTRQFFCFYALVRELTNDDTAFDADYSLAKVLRLSRLIHPNPAHMGYSARVTLGSDGSLKQVRPEQFVCRAWCRHNNRRWLTRKEWELTGHLLCRWECSKAKTCKRIHRSLIFLEKAATEFHLEISSILIVAAVESLYKIWNGPNQKRGPGGKKEFSQALQQLGQDVGLPINEESAKTIWEYRSKWNHGNTFVPTQAKWDAEINPLFHGVQCVLGSVLKRTIECDEYASNFENDESVEHWLGL